MQRPVSVRSVVRARRVRTLRHAPRAACHGFTLVEILVTTVLALMLLGAVTAMLGKVGESVTNSRAMLEMADRLRLAQARLQMDLNGITVTMRPPRDPANNEGYLEYIEGPVTAGTFSASIARNSDNTTTLNNDRTVGDFDDILMFTTRNAERPFMGLCNGTSIQSDVAEVAWFLRGRTLHRRVLLVAPGANLSAATNANFYKKYDISARYENGAMVANTLADLTRRECRFAHGGIAGTYPYDVRGWYWTSSGYQFPTLPTLNECTCTGWTTDRAPTTSGSISTVDFWTNRSGYYPAENALTGATGTRVTDDIILTNVIGFDVKAWDPVAGDYVNLGYNNTPYSDVVANGLSHLGLKATPTSSANSQLTGSATTARIYDTYSTSYEALFGTSANGIDDKNVGLVDGDSEKTCAPPYPIPLRGIQVKIRVFEPDSRQIRDVTVIQGFLPQ
jgi:prepilin-type N-terminal cleavage/methylation domain-containing protein